METIDTSVLKTIRKARKVGRPKMAKLTGLTERQISKLETDSATHSEVSLAMLLRFSSALQVPSGVLTGEVPAAEEDMTPLSQPCCAPNSGCCG